jgi:hypothetical protein
VKVTIYREQVKVTIYLEQVKVTIYLEQVKVTYVGKLEDGTVFDQQTSEKKALVLSNVDAFLPRRWRIRIQQLTDLFLYPKVD